jgi:hypothetical protein
LNGLQRQAREILWIHAPAAQYLAIRLFRRRKYRETGTKGPCFADLNACFDEDQGIAVSARSFLAKLPILSNSNDAGLRIAPVIWPNLRGFPC